ncbi:MAG: redoxin family protein [Mogibacterium sp.]|nr:redoxin family protein [Mogibacterium sp.]
MDNKDTEKNLWWDKCRPSRRRLIQLYSAVLYNAYAKGFIKGEIYTGNTKLMCVPGFNCYSCPAAIGACPLGSLQNALASSGSRAGFYVFGIIMLWGLMLGRTICGWICPMGLIQELLYKIPTPKIRKNKATHALTYLKYFFLAVFAISIPLWYGLKHGKAVPGFCKFICPAGTLEAAVGLLSNPGNASFFKMLGIFFTRKFVIMLLIGLACVFCFRSFCRFICPLGAIYGMFNKLAVVGVKVDADRCTHCGACAMNCRMDVRHVGDHECVSCAKCMDVCRQGAISLKAGKVTLIAPSCGCADDKADSEARRAKGKRIAWGVAIAVLAFALLWYNVLDKSGEAEAAAGSAGAAETETDSYAAGGELADFTIECTDGQVFHLGDYRGDVVFINLWATYCGPCVEELPYFNELAGEHAEDAVVLAVHNSMSKDDIPAYLADKGWDNLRIALDTKDKLVWNTVGGGSTMPQTIVLDRKGKVIYNHVGSVTADLLAKLYEQASADTD